MVTVAGWQVLDGPVMREVNGDPVRARGVVRLRSSGLVTAGERPASVEECAPGVTEHWRESPGEHQEEKHLRTWGGVRGIVCGHTPGA